jgi:hypothetical protein
MTLFDVEELTRYWIDHPPPHLMIAAYLGIGRERGKRASVLRGPSGNKSTSAAEIGHILAELGPGFGSGDVHAGLSPVVLNFSELRRKTTATDGA